MIDILIGVAIVTVFIVAAIALIAVIVEVFSRDRWRH